MLPASFTTTFALETKMTADWDQPEAPLGQGGLLAWKDALNYLRLSGFVINAYRGDIRLEARMRGEYRIIGRGLLRGDTFHLRLERTGERFAALCSADGVHWLTCGREIFPVKDPLRVGVWAGQGMAAHFDYVQLLDR